MLVGGDVVTYPVGASAGLELVFFLKTVPLSQNIYLLI